MLSQIIKDKIQPSLKKLEFNKPLEAYRGLCALLVILNHGMCHEDWFFKSFRFNEFLHYTNAGYLSVMVFFCMSGYVIGVTNNRATLNFTDYLKKRAIRLYPTYILSIILSLFVVQNLKLTSLAGNLFFLQNSNSYFGFNVPIFVNGATWSLNYEVVYYLLFGIIFFMKPNVWLFCFFCLMASIGLIHSNSAIAFIAHYLNGFAFWMIGLLFAWKKKGVSDVQSNFSSCKWSLLSLLFVHLCQNHLGLGMIIMNLTRISSTNNFNWLFDLPFCIMILASLTSTENLFIKINKVFVYVAPGLLFIYLAFEKRIFENERWIMCLIFWILALLFYKERRVSEYLMFKLEWIGKISYGVYILHEPIIFLIAKYLIINNLYLEIILKYSLWLSITFILAYFMEIKLQPKFKLIFK